MTALVYEHCICLFCRCPWRWPARWTWSCSLWTPRPATSPSPATAGPPTTSSTPGRWANVRINGCKSMSFYWYSICESFKLTALLVTGWQPDGSTWLVCTCVLTINRSTDHHTTRGVSSFRHRSQSQQIFSEYASKHQTKMVDESLSWICLRAAGCKRPETPLVHNISCQTTRMDDGQSRRWEGDMETLSRVSAVWIIN